MNDYGIGPWYRIIAILSDRVVVVQDLLMEMLGDTNQLWVLDTECEHSDDKIFDQYSDDEYYRDKINRKYDIYEELKPPWQ